MGHKQSIMVKPAELLGLSTGIVDGLAHVFISLRIDMGSLAATNFALPASQARRLLDDLTRRFEESALLKRIRPPDPGLRRAYEQIISERLDNTEEEPPHE